MLSSILESCRVCKYEADNFQRAERSLQTALVIYKLVISKISTANKQGNAQGDTCEIRPPTSKNIGRVHCDVEAICNFSGSEMEVSSTSQLLRSFLMLFLGIFS